MIQLDHASLKVLNLARARWLLENRLGFSVTVTPQASDRHGRIFLDRGYVEVSLAGESADEPRELIQSWSNYFFRAPEVRSFVRQARQRGVELSGPTVYHGHDGEWLDAVIVGTATAVALPGIIQRLTPPEVAADWPPPLSTPHPNGTERLASIYLLAETAADATAPLAVLSKLAAGRATIDQWQLDPFLRAHLSTLSLPGSQRLVAGYAAGPGRADSWLKENGPGIFAAGFGTRDLSYTKAFLAGNDIVSGRAGSDTGDSAGPLWVEPFGELGVFLSFELLSPNTST